MAGLFLVGINLAEGITGMGINAGILVVGVMIV